MTGWVYIMANKPFGLPYIGVTSDLKDRVWDHKNDVHEGFTKKYRLHTLVWFEQHPNIVLAIRREKVLKRYPRQWKLNLIEGLNPKWADLYDRVYEIKNVYRPSSQVKGYEHYWDDGGDPTHWSETRGSRNG